MRAEYLIYFREKTTALGVMPPHYYIATDVIDRAAALLMGGKDVSDNDAHWREWEREQNLDYMHG